MNGETSFSGGANLVPFHLQAGQDLHSVGQVGCYCIKKCFACQITE